jgi:hypothetical protein
VVTVSTDELLDVVKVALIDTGVLIATAGVFGGLQFPT